MLHQVVGLSPATSSKIGGLKVPLFVLSNELWLVPRVVSVLCVNLKLKQRTIINMCGSMIALHLPQGIT